MKSCLVCNCVRPAQQGSSYCCWGCATGLDHAPSCTTRFVNDRNATLDREEADHG